MLSEIITKMARNGSKRIYTVDSKVYDTNWKLFGEDWKCQFCRELFLIGDKIMALYNKNIKWYHKKCYDLTFYDS